MTQPSAGKNVWDWEMLISHKNFCNWGTMSSWYYLHNPITMELKERGVKPSKLQFEPRLMYYVLCNSNIHTHEDSLKSPKSCERTVYKVPCTNWPIVNSVSFLPVLLLLLWWWFDMWLMLDEDMTVGTTVCSEGATTFVPPPPELLLLLLCWWRL